MIVPGHQRASRLNPKPAGSRLLGHVQVIGIQGVPLAFNQILRYLWKYLLPHFHSPLGGNFGTFFGHRVHRDREETDRALYEKRQFLGLGQNQRSGKQQDSGQNGEQSRTMKAFQQKYSDKGHTQQSQCRAVT